MTKLMTFFLLIFFIACADCEMTIDSYEVATTMNIPKTGGVNCHYDDKTNIKITVFDLVLEGLDIEEYIETYNFKAVDSSFTPNTNMKGNYLLTPEEQQFPANDRLFERKGTRKEKEYYYILDKVSGRLWGEIYLMKG